MDIASFKGVSADGGRWIDIPSMPGVALKVRSASYPDYLDEIARLTRKTGREALDEDGSLKFSAQRSIQGAAMTKHILLDWRGLTNAGADQPYDAALAEDLLTSPGCIFQDNSLFAAVEYASKQVSTGAGVEDIAKN